MLKLIESWKGVIEIDGVKYESVKDAQNALKSRSDKIHIVLHASAQNATESAGTRLKQKIEQNTDKTEYKITVKAYMTREATPEFDFMAKWNNNNPMPLRTMTGTIEKETKGMVYMKLHGQAEPAIKCMRCGRTLTNEVSKMYGIGPECITKIPTLSHLDINDVVRIKNDLVNVTWEGWIIRSSILEQKIVERRQRIIERKEI